MIKLLICDGDGTIPSNSSELKNFIGELSKLGIGLAVATNSTKLSVQNKFHSLDCEPPLIIVSKNDIGKSKPAPEFIDHIGLQSGFKPSEMLYIGDDDSTDIFCAINAGILPLAAKYSPVNKTSYGIPIANIEYLIRYLKFYTPHNSPFWGWQYKGTCSDTNTPIDMRALIYQHADITYLKDLLKGNINRGSSQDKLNIRGVLLSEVINNYLATRLFLNDDFHDSKSTILTVYPGHRPGSYSDVLSYFADSLSKVRKAFFHKDLLLRHKISTQSKTLTGSRNIFEQFQTIKVNSAKKSNIEGKHIIVLDDYTTTGNSLEVARRFLTLAGAEKVTCIAVGKFRSKAIITNISKEWDPYNTCTLSASDINTISVSGQTYNSADNNFLNIYNQLL